MQIVCTKISAKLGIEMIFKKLARCKKDIKLEQLPVLFEIIESKSIQMQKIKTQICKLKLQSSKKSALQSCKKTQLKMPNIS